jgi:hypothetical protein
MLAHKLHCSEQHSSSLVRCSAYKRPWHGYACRVNVSSVIFVPSTLYPRRLTANTASIVLAIDAAAVSAPARRRSGRTRDSKSQVCMLISIFWTLKRSKLILCPTRVNVGLHHARQQTVRRLCGRVHIAGMVQPSISIVIMLL